MTTRQSVDQSAIGIMVIFCMIMASQQVVLKAVADDIAPVFQIALRSGIAGILLIALILLQRQKLPLSQENRLPAMLIGILFSLEYLFLGEALQYTSAGHATVFLYTSPIFAAIGLHWKVPGERMAPLQWLGIMLAFSGVVLSFYSGDTKTDNPEAILWGDFLALLAGASWGATTIVVRASGLGALPARQTLLYQLLGAFIILTAWALLTEQTQINFTPELWTSLAFHGIGVSFLCFLVWFWLLTRYKASQLGTLSFLTPVFGVLFGSWLLGESIDPRFIIGSALIIGGVLLVSSYDGLVRWQLRRKALNCRS
ncbi:DMT family transporter [Oceanospirillum sediminis]|uniref:DMT family transporter n=1 Tax=Oceanospirillum sediminis TaxID=2760088 RepID=A0A839IX52_9GAMM|nr:DMT family transporter [Oceanospirillum sediminis]MBB1489528.1 DMT family transporter [Oceanospirillum sediminis]